jgi:hypothetical protein
VCPGRKTRCEFAVPGALTPSVRHRPEAVNVDRRLIVERRQARVFVVGLNELASVRSVGCVTPPTEASRQPL